MTPICDLMSRNGVEPAATSVLMLQGTLRPTYYKHELDTQIIILGGQFYEVDWEIKRPQALPLKDLRKDVRKGKRVWLGRLKAEHFLALQSKYLTSFARIGLLKAPAVFEPLAGKICVREGNELFQLDDGFDTKSGYAFRSPDRNRDVSKQPIFFTGAFLDHFKAVLGQAASSANRSGETRSRAQGLLDRMGQLVQMVTRQPPASHAINQYLRVDLLGERSADVPVSADGLILIVLKP